MNEQLLEFLKEHHTLNGHIKIDESDEILGETAIRISEHQSTDIDVMECQLIESELAEKLMAAMVSRNTLDVVVAVMDLDKLAEKNLIETIDRLLRAEL